mgnify:CR=1 FL=1|jgi:hypothetical protein
MTALKLLLLLPLLPLGIALALLAMAFLPLLDLRVVTEDQR